MNLPKNLLPRARMELKLFISLFFISTFSLLIAGLIWLIFYQNGLLLKLIQLLNLTAETTNSSLHIAIFTVFILLSLIGFTGLLSFLIAKKIVEPIKKLHEGIQKIARGNFEYRLNLQSGDEMEDLGLELNTLAAKLETDMTQLTTQNRLLAAIRSLDIAALSTLDIKRFSQNIVDLIQGELGYLIGVMAIIDEEKGVLKRMAISQTYNPHLQQVLKTLPIPFQYQEVPLTYTENLLIKVINEKKSHYTEKLYDIQKGIFNPEVSNFIQNSFGIKGTFIYPLISKEKIIGVLYYMSTITKEDISNLEYTIMEEFAHEVARALDNIFLYQEIKVSQEITSAERNKLAVVLSGIKDAVIAVDLNKKIITFNKSAENLTGMEIREVKNKPIDQVIKLFNQNNEVFSSQYCPIQTNDFEGVVFQQQNLKMVSARKEACVNLISSKIKEGKNVNLGCILTLHDVGKERELEEMKIDFVSMAAHELRTPLTSIQGYLSVFINENKDKLNDEQNFFLNRAYTSIKHLMILVEDLLNVSRIEKGVTTIHFQPEDIVSIIKQTTSDFTKSAKEKSLELVFLEPEKPLPKVVADKFKISEVLSNLISNAITYTQTGGKIWISVEDKETEVVVHVQDNGQGIPKEILPHLFTKFYRFSKKSEEPKGLGLGLYISKSIIQMHHGKIWVESEVNKGSTFSFSLPVYQETGKTLNLREMAATKSLITSH